MFQIDGVPLVGVEVNFQFDILSDADKHVFKDDGTFAGRNAQLHHILVFNAVISGFFRGHMDMTRGADNAFFKIDDACRTDKNSSGRAL